MGHTWLVVSSGEVLAIGAPMKPCEFASLLLTPGRVRHKCSLGPTSKGKLGLQTNFPVTFLCPHTSHNQRLQAGRAQTEYLEFDLLCCLIKILHISKSDYLESVEISKNSGHWGLPCYMTTVFWN